MYTRFDVERLEKEYNAASTKRGRELIAKMIAEVKAEIEVSKR